MAQMYIYVGNPPNLILIFKFPCDRGAGENRVLKTMYKQKYIYKYICMYV